MARPATRNDAIAIAVTGGFVAVGSLLPWARALFFTLAGTDGDGVFTLIAGVIIAVVALVSRDKPSSVARVAVFLLFGLSVFIVWGIYENLSDDPDTIGAGLYLTLFASVVGVVMALAWMTRTVTKAAIDEEPAPPPTGRHSE